MMDILIYLFVVYIYARKKVKKGYTENNVVIENNAVVGKAVVGKAVVGGD